MTEVEFSPLLSELTETAAALNRESDSINSLIERFQQMLRELNVGIPVWVDLYDQPDTRLGWIKGSTDEWMLVIKDDRPVFAKPLLEMSRDMRISALHAFPGLVAQLNTAAEAALRTIKEAKEFVK